MSEHLPQYKALSADQFAGLKGVETATECLDEMTRTIVRNRAKLRDEFAIAYLAENPGVAIRDIELVEERSSRLPQNHVVFPAERMSNLFGVAMLLHHFPQIGVDAGLVSLAQGLQPCQEIGVQPNCDGGLLRAIEAADHRVRWNFSNLGDIGKVDLTIWFGSELAQLLTFLSRQFRHIVSFLAGLQDGRR